MFVDDRPIEDQKDDRLGRSGFSINLANSIIEWKGLESLVIALYGRWGSGKSSVINLAKSEIAASKEVGKPTVIEFNPWLFSGDDKLSEHFFNEIANELRIKNASVRDAELAAKLRSYARLFGLIPDNETMKQLLLVVGLAGVSAGEIFQQGILSWIGIVLLLATSVIDRIADYLEKRGIMNQKSVLALKEDIKKNLSKRGKKILLIVDDLDRLTPDEVRVILKLIKANTDFPNVIYLLSFDREVVQKALEEQPGISGQDYLEKIVQVSFDIPVAKQEKIEKLLFEELDRVLATLPKSSETLFDQTYWGNVYHSGLRTLFRNIRDVKRYASSLEFNLSLMHRGESMEVNPIDFIAVEALRVFAPSFYGFMRTRKDLFTSTDRDQDRSGGNSRAKEITDEIAKLPEPLREDIKNILARLFPQVEGVLRNGYSTHGSDWLPAWSRQLRVCSPSHFDAYFTLIPGGDESELSQFEIDSLLTSVNSLEAFEKPLRDFLAAGKIRKVLGRLQDYTSDETKIPISAHRNVILALFNISDELPSEKMGMFDFGPDIQIARIVYQLLNRVADKQANFTIYREAVENSKGLYGPIYCISLESQKDEKEKDDLVVVPKEKLPDLQQAGLAKIEEFRVAGELGSHTHLLSILYTWREWATEEVVKGFVGEITADDAGLILFLKGFVSESISQSMGDYVGRKRKKFNYKSLGDFMSADVVKQRLEIIRADASQVYLENKDLIDMFLNNFGKPAGPLDD